MIAMVLSCYSNMIFFLCQALIILGSFLFDKVVPMKIGFLMLPIRIELWYCQWKLDFDVANKNWALMLSMRIGVWMFYHECRRYILWMSCYQMMSMYFMGSWYENIILKIALNEFLHKMIAMVLSCYGNMIFFLCQTLIILGSFLFDKVVLMKIGLWLLPMRIGLWCC